MSKATFADLYEQMRHESSKQPKAGLGYRIWDASIIVEELCLAIYLEASDKLLNVFDLVGGGCSMKMDEFAYSEESMHRCECGETLMKSWYFCPQCGVFQSSEDKSEFEMEKNLAADEARKFVKQWHEDHPEEAPQHVNAEELLSKLYKERSEEAEAADVKEDNGD